MKDKGKKSAGLGRQEGNKDTEGKTNRGRGRNRWRRMKKDRD